MEGPRQSNWFEKKFINPRTAEGELQTERIEYARELFESFGNQEPRFSGAAIVGSAVKGYGLENSDIDVALFYKEVPKQGWIPERELMGIMMPASRAMIYSFEKDFSDFKENFDEKRRQENKKVFQIDRLPTDLGHHFKTTIFGNTKISFENLMDCERLFYELSYPTLGTKNPRALMSIEDITNEMKRVVAKVDDEQKRRLIEKILESSTSLFKGEYEKISKRIPGDLDKEHYIASRRNMLKQRLKNKFNLVV